MVPAMANETEDKKKDQELESESNVAPESEGGETSAEKEEIAAAAEGGEPSAEESDTSSEGAEEEDDEDSDDGGEEGDEDEDEAEAVAPAQHRSRSTAATSKDAVKTTAGGGIFLAAVVALGIGVAGGWYAREARVNQEAEKATAAGGADACQTWEGKICEGTAPQAPACMQAKAASKLLTAPACSAALADVPGSLAKIKAERADCDNLVGKLCKDLGPETKTCKMVTDKTQMFPAERCTAMLGQYDQVLSSLKKMEEGGGPGMSPHGPGPGMGPHGRPPGAPPMSVPTPKPAPGAPAQPTAAPKPAPAAPAAPKQAAPKPAAPKPAPAAPAVPKPAPAAPAE